MYQRSTGTNSIHCRNGYVDVVQCLMEDGNGDANCVTKGGFTAIHWARYGGHLIVVQFLIRHTCVKVEKVSSTYFNGVAYE